MDIQATAQLLGNFGEFFGAIAVLATLVYLVIQIKQNNKLSATTYTNYIAFHRLLSGPCSTPTTLWFKKGGLSLRIFHAIHLQPSP